jgi:hypothetical protein
MIALDDLLSMSNVQLAATLRDGHPVDPTSLDDTQYQGISLGLPGWIVSITWLKFMKTFHRDPSTQRLRGWNVRIVQDGLDAPWTPQVRRNGTTRTFGHFEVVDTDGRALPAGTDRGLLIDYGAGRGSALDPMRMVRDPVVAVNPDDPTLLLGWSYVRCGFNVPTPSYFSLRLDGPLQEIAA